MVLVHDTDVWIAEIRSVPVIPNQTLSDPLKNTIHKCLLLKDMLSSLVKLERYAILLSFFRTYTF